MAKPVQGRFTLPKPAFMQLQGIENYIKENFGELHQNPYI
jgi:hypothetical protein